MRWIWVMVFFLLFGSVEGQSQTTLTLDEYINIVKKNHPVTFQASLLYDMAASTKKIARGGFDPKIEADLDNKSFDDKNYYALASGRLKVPTWYGIDLKAGYDRNSGQFLNDSDFVPTRGLWNAGISIPLGKGLVIDNRRAELKRADIYQSVTEQERILMINELLYNATNAYLDWQVAYAYFDIAEEGQELAILRFEGTRSSFINGDKPAIDTLESFISLQSRQLDVQKAQQALENASIALNNYLWMDGAVPLEMEEGTLPENINMQLLETVIDSLSLQQSQWIASHPELLLYDYKLDNLALDQRLAKEELKPDLRIQYNPLIGVADDALFDQLNANNYKLGVNFSYPILQRKERGKIEMNQLKIENTTYERTLKNQDLSVKLDTYINNIDQVQAQYILLEETVANYDRMLIAENRKLSLGESSIFLVNNRENKYLESRYKMTEVSRKLLRNRLTYLLYACRLNQMI